MKTTTKLLAFLLALFCLIPLTACEKDEPDFQSTAIYVTDTTLGEGAKTLTLTVEAGDTAVHFTIHTDAETVGEAVQAVGLLEGEEGAYGLYVKRVNGILADYDIDQSYWAFYIGEEMAMTGVDATEIVPGTEYRLVYTK